jgi:mannose-6-phosphate isomerase-like protein (cupin superfamily)
MPETTSSDAPYPYETRLDVLHGPLEPIDVPALAAAVTHPWFNQTLCKVNESVVRVGVVKGEYHWHHHEADDEFFYVVEGRLLVDLEDRTIALDPGQGLVVPKGARHRTRAPQRTIILMVENAGIVPTGDPS